MKPGKTRGEVDAAVTALQERLADGDPSDLALRSRCEADLKELRADYKADPSAFTKDAIEALRELVELLQSG